MSEDALPELLHRFRAKRRINLEELAAQTSIPLDTLKGWSRGKPAGNAGRIAAYLLRQLDGDL